MHFDLAREDKNSQKLNTVGEDTDHGKHFSLSRCQ